MKSAVASLSALVLLAASVLGQATINTPQNVVVCQPTLITWSGGSPPYTLSLTPGNSPGSAAIKDLTSDTTATSFTWVADEPVGTSLGLNLRDSTGAIYQTAAFQIFAGSDTSCLGGSSSSASVTESTSSVIVSTSTAVSSVTVSTSTAITTTTTSTGASSTTAAPVPSVTSSLSSVINSITSHASSALSSAASHASSATSAAASPSATNAASINGVNAGVVGVVGALAALILA